MKQVLLFDASSLHFLSCREPQRITA